MALDPGHYRIWGFRQPMGTILGYVHVTGFDLWAIYVTTTLTVFAGIVNGSLAIHGPRRLRPLFGAIAALAFFYSVAYVLLLVGSWSQTEWTRAIRVVGWLVWLLVWTYTPWKFHQLAREAAVRTARKRVEVADVLVAKVAEAIGVSVDEVISTDDVGTDDE